MEKRWNVTQTYPIGGLFYWFFAVLFSYRLAGPLRSDLQIYSICLSVPAASAGMNLAIDFLVRFDLDAPVAVCLFLASGALLGACTPPTVLRLSPKARTTLPKTKLRALYYWLAVVVGGMASLLLTSAGM